MATTHSSKSNNIVIYIIIILSIIGFIGLFIWYNERSINIYNEELTKINNMFYTNYYDTNSIISNHNEINKRIIFLEERIAHYQNNSNNFASLWLALLSVLFITVTGFNLYNFNESKKRLDKEIERAERTFPETNRNENTNPSNNFNNTGDNNE